VLTEQGAGVGDSEQRISELYGRVTVQFHKYRPEGRNLIVTDPADSMLRIIFETDSGRVVRYRAGRRPPVDYVEGCS
jgi:pyruvate/2-oxoglutarate dehydrogenase complex dihydrolipoamide dehydrogenase (E3) component